LEARSATQPKVAQQELRRIASKFPHVQRYLSDWVRRSKETPSYAEELKRDWRHSRHFNIIYPVGDPMFIHIYSREGERPVYSPVVPTAPPESEELLALAEEGLGARISSEHTFETREEHEKLLHRILDELLVLDDSLGPWEYKELRKNKRLTGLAVNEETLEALRFQLTMEKVYLGAIEPFIRDSYIEDISCDGVGPIFVEHKIFGSCETTVRIEDEEKLDDFVRRLSERTGRPVTYRRPIVDASLPDGSRINMVFGNDVSKRGSNFTVRKFSEKPVSITSLVSWGTLSSLQAAYLWLLLEFGMSIWFCGETASGKTTLMRALCVFINPKKKIISIEDTPEIIVPHDNWIREVTRQSEEGESSIELFDLLKAALRQRPEYILVGEIRGPEAAVAFQAMQTGAPVLSTFHAGSVEKLIQRLTGEPINIPRSYIDVLNCVVFQGAVRIPRTGRVERRITSINEIAGFDPVENRFDYVELFSWDPSNDAHTFRGEGNSFLLEGKIRNLMGIPAREARRMYLELEKRAQVLESLVMLGVTDYGHVWNVVKHAYDEGIDSVVSQIDAGKKVWLPKN